MNPYIQQAIRHKDTLHIHLVSGETYIGICEAHHNPNLFIIHTEEASHCLPYWSIKRVKKENLH
ncbi:hypothetical protein [Paenibacillus wulumuqiensis]|uniref:hypothetical protein n=1 Tax=Paenibacillus wulumuqiensis TaxID=1567107 RepID=UPI0006195047|nr:hypothetical protein [Paenibacillus wulumuqiensis]